MVCLHKSDDRMSVLKRNNWTNEEVIELLNGCKLYKIGGDPDGVHNHAIDGVIHQFYDFQRPDDESGAMAYHTEDKFIYHIGPPLPQKNPPSEKDKEAYNKWKEAREERLKSDD